MLLLFALAIIAPFVLLALPFRIIFRTLRRYTIFLRNHDYRTMQLLRASHGMAGIIIAALAWLLLSNSGNPYWDAAGPWVLSALAIWGFVVFLDGARKSRGEFDGYIAFRSFVKIALGALVLYNFQESITQHIKMVSYSYSYLVAIGDPLPLAIELATVALWAFGFWCIVTGLTKCLLLLRGIKRRPKPPVRENPHGKSKFADPKEAPKTMGGEGRRSKSEGVKF